MSGVIIGSLIFGYWKLNQIAFMLSVRKNIMKKHYIFCKK